MRDDLDGAFDVWPDVMAAVEVFAAMCTQWRTGQAGAIGLDYTALPIVLRGMGRRMTPELFNDLQTMEGEALRVLTEKRPHG